MGDSVGLGDFYRDSIDFTSEKKSSLVFQILNVDQKDVATVSEESEEEEEEKYTIFLYGCTELGESVGVRVTGFAPYFWVRVDGDWDPTDVRDFVRLVRGKMYQRGRYLVGGKLEEKMIFYPFTNNKKYKFVKLLFSSYGALKRCTYIFDRVLVWKGRERKFKICENKLDPHIRFTHIADILTAGWVKVLRYEHNDDEVFRCQWDISTRWNNIVHEEKDKIAPFVIFSFDIECMSEDGEAFPDPENDGDQVIQIGTTLCRYGDNKMVSHIVNLGGCRGVDTGIVETVGTEKELIRRWIRFWRRVDPDIVIGYNIWNFDFSYIYKRALRYGYEEELSKLGRLCEESVKFSTDTLVSNAYGYNEFKKITTPGVLQVDLLTQMRRDHKLESYKLDDVGYHFLKEKKHDVHPREIFALFKKTDLDRGTVAKYCIQDTILPLKLLLKLSILPNLIEMAKVTRVPVEYLITRGQQIKVYSQLIYCTRKKGYVVPTIEYDESADKKFKGATVLHANKGAYGMNTQDTMDYPVAGLDFASLYPSIMIAFNYCHSTIVLNEEFDNLEGVEYEDIEWWEDGEHHKYRFVQNRKGVLPEILEYLWTTRKAVKKQMNKEQDPFLKAIYNGKQLAIKVTMNSIYGFCGANKGMLPCKPIAACTTGKGRQMIEWSKKCAEEFADAEVVYGDSVVGDTPLLLREDGEVYLEAIENLVENHRWCYRCFGKKEVCIPRDRDLQVWSDKGFTCIKKIIRHKTKKKVFRILTYTGCVDVTEDHSLLLKDGSRVKPSEVRKGMELLHKSYFENLQPSSESSVILSRIEVRGKMEAARSFHKWKKDKKEVYLKESKDDVYVFEVVYGSDYVQCLKMGNEIREITELGYRDDYVYDLETGSHHFQAGIGSMIVHNTDSIYTKFHTDLHGESLGPGTPRIMERTFEIAQVIADKISATFKAPIELEFEKVMWPFLLFTKKRYACLMWTRYEEPDGIDCKGIQVVRRDNCPIVREVSKEILDEIMYNRDVPKAQSIAKRVIRDLLEYRIPIDKLILSKSLRHNYKSENVPHKKLAEKMFERDPMNAPKKGDRVPYVFVETGTYTELQYEKVEDPVYAQEHNLKPDVLYYLEHQLRSPLETLFELLMDDTAVLFREDTGYDDMIDVQKKEEKEYKRVQKNKKSGNQEITKFFSRV